MRGGKSSEEGKIKIKKRGVMKERENKEGSEAGKREGSKIFTFTMNFKQSLHFSFVPKRITKQTQKRKSSEFTKP